MAFLPQTKGGFQVVIGNTEVSPPYSPPILGIKNPHLR